ncbi:DNA ligase D [Noviherbaspirillum aridicola]|uniref:DNA ligase (ATP) n=1 Tax=Noviherbaspirillum aridicola TaxID=2849687 RepID=A0ABQ4Q588_9BURK|nr:DNA ligase D [Noviherbaspirillum aridicola]GIZ52362.1 ATP-dependent DNA ligase [Noviherbaspirillum aridicola]
MPDKLATYHAKRNFSVTPEPRGAVAEPGERLRFVIQKHHARRLHYDFRLEFDGTLKSWAVPKGPSLDPAEKRLAVHVEDHPLDYMDFHGDIPEKQYGAGHVEVWDTGYWEPLGDPSADYRKGKLKFRLDGEKLQGGWTLVRTRLQASGDKEQWLLIKEQDEQARAQRDYDITEDMPHSVEAPEQARQARARARNPRPAPGTTLAPAKLTKAVKQPLPETLRPQLATLVEDIPRGADWIYEVKFDGYRMLARVDGAQVTLYTRDGNDWTARLPGVAKAVKALGLGSAWLDGEIVVLDAQGVPSFQLLQKAFDSRSTADIVYFVFDLPYCGGYDLRNTPLIERHALLQQRMEKNAAPTLRYSAPIPQPPASLLESACRLSMEGIIGKRADSIYLGKRSPNWIKLKCRRRQEFVVVGYTEPQGARQFFGALLLAVYGEDGKLRYAGRVGTGFDGRLLADLHGKLKSLEQDSLPFERMPAGLRRGDTHWVKPQLVAEVSFAEWTADHMLRQAVFHGLRKDKRAREVRREQAAALPVNGKADAAAPRARGDTVQGVKITHPDRVIDPHSGLTKLDLALYYEAVAPWLLPYLEDRPVYLLRCPEGIQGEHFFQKHLSRVSVPGMRTLDPELDPDHDPLMVIDDARALVGAAQMGTIELHTGNATADRIDRPDHMVFDLDPDPSLPWQAMVEAAQLLKVMLDELGLKGFLKTSGGKGLHVVVPLARRQGWDEAADFSLAIAQHMARTLPRLFSARMGEKNRVGKIFIDTLRNRRQASTASVYSVRARPGLPVSVPIAWEELHDIGGGGEWTIATLPRRLQSLRDDPWRDFGRTRQSLTAAMKKRLGLGGK